MLKEILKKLGVEFAEDISDEEAKALIEEQIDAKDNHITELEGEKENLSKSNEELSASVEGIKADKAKVDEELAVTKGKLDQITGLYKENFSKPSNNDEPKLEEKVTGDVMQMMIDSN